MQVIDQVNLEKLNALNNEHVLRIVKEFINLCKPIKVTVITDIKDNIEYVARRAIAPMATVVPGIPNGTDNISPIKAKITAKIVASKGVINPDGIGRCGVLILSLCRSRTSLKAFPAARMSDAETAPDNVRSSHD